MKNVEKQKEIDENFKELMKDDGGKMILAFLIASMFMPKEELERLSKSKIEAEWERWKEKLERV